MIGIGDSRFYSATLQSNGLWTAHNVGCVGSDPNTLLSCVDWLDIDPATGSVLQEGLYGFDGTYVYAGDITADAYGNTVLVFEAPFDAGYVGAYYAARQSSDPPNVLSQPWRLKRGEGCYERSPNNVVGLHSALDMDPRDGSFWMAAAYSKGNSPDCKTNDWSIAIGAVTFGGPTAAAQLGSARATATARTRAAEAQLSMKGGVHRPSKALRHAQRRADAADPGPNRGELRGQTR